MKFMPSFTVLLNAVLVAVSIVEDVQAVPTGRHEAALGTRELPNTALEYNDPPSISNITTRAPTEPRVVNIPLQAIQLGQRDAGYIGGFRVGAQAHLVPMLVDTGSSTFWVKSNTADQRGFDPSNSKDLGRTWEIEYGDGSTASGPVVEDVVKVGSLDALPDFPIGIGNTLSGILTTLPERGVVGFANGQVGPGTRTGGPTLLEGLKKVGLIPASVVGIQLGRGASIGTAGTGRISIGGPDITKFQTGTGNSVTVRNTATSGLWALKLAKSKVGGRTVRTSRSTILDTGSNHIWTTNGDAKFFHSFPGAFMSENGICVVPCDPTEIPQISFTVGSVEFPINPIDIIGPEIVIEGIEKGSLCFSFIQDHEDKPGSPPRTTWSLGIPFLKNVYQVLDSDKNEITLAKLA